MKHIAKSVLTLLILLCAATSYAATIRANSCSYSDVRSAINAASAGDTVIVPAGVCNWGGNTLSISKAITLRGAGAGSSSTCNSATSTCISGTGMLFSIATGSNARFSFDMSGFYLASTCATSSYSLIATITGAGYGWHIHNIYLYRTTGGKGTFNINANSTSWTLYGLLNSNIFKNIYMYLNGGGTAAEHGWQASSDWGGANWTFIENNVFDLSDLSSITVAIDNQNGGRGVVRYNVFKDGYIMTHSACQTSVRGGRAFDIYNNVFLGTLQTSTPDYVALKAGSGVVTRNYVAGRWTWGGGSQGVVNINNRRSWFDSACVAQLGNCDGTNANDTNIQNPAHGGAVDGYICLDQPGAGCGTKGSQTSDPIYIWGNTSGRVCRTGADRYKACTTNSDCVNSDCSTEVLTPNNVYKHNDTGNQPYHIVSGRDYFDAVSGNNIKPGYTNYTCPHPLAGSGSCDYNVAGTAGYSLSGSPAPPDPEPTGLILPWVITGG